MEQNDYKFLTSIADRLTKTYVESKFGERVIAVLVDDALSSFQVIRLRRWFPPFLQIAIRTELASLFGKRGMSLLLYFPNDVQSIKPDRRSRE